jgi:hypothetical protein
MTKDKKQKKTMETRRLNSMYMLQGKLMNNACLFDFKEHKKELSFL